MVHSICRIEESPEIEEDGDRDESEDSLEETDGELLGVEVELFDTLEVAEELFDALEVVVELFVTLEVALTLLEWLKEGLALELWEDVCDADADLDDEEDWLDDDEQLDEADVEVVFEPLWELDGVFELVNVWVAVWEAEAPVDNDDVAEAETDAEFDGEAVFDTVIVVEVDGDSEPGDLLGDGLTEGVGVLVICDRTVNRIN